MTDTDRASITLPEEMSCIDVKQEKETKSQRQCVKNRIEFLWDIALEICEHFQFISTREVYRKLQNNLVNPRYKVIVLEDCINTALEEGYDVADTVFQIQEVWHNELTSQANHIDIKNECELKKESEIKTEHDIKKEGDIKTENNEVIDRINFLSEVIPGISKEKISKDLTNCSSNDVNKYISTYINSKITLDDTKLTLKREHRPINTTDENSAIDNNVKFKSSRSTASDCTSHEKHQKSDEVCEIVDIVKYKPCVIDLDEDSNPSAESDIVVVDEVNNSNTNNVNIINFQQSLDSGDDLNPETEVTFDNIEQDPTLGKEADDVVALLPYLVKNNVHQSLLDNYYDPQRRSKVLGEYIELALEEGHEISSHVFETLNFWQVMNRKRSSDLDSDPAICNAKKIKLNNSNPSAFDHKVMETSFSASESNHSLSLPKYGSGVVQPLAGYPVSDIATQYPQLKPSASLVAIPHEQNLPSSSSEQSKPIDADIILRSMAEETRKWYLQKADFLAEIAPGLGKNYILNQIIYCKDESDIMNITPRLLEESSNVIEEGITEASPLYDSIKNDGPSLENEGIAGASAQDPSLPSTSRDDQIQMSAADIEDSIQSHIQQLGEMFNDADPDFLAERANEVAGVHDKFVELVVELTENRSYPKMEEYLKRQQKMEMRRKFIEGMSVEEFLEYFEDPEKRLSILIMPAADHLEEPIRSGLGWIAGQSSYPCLIYAFPRINMVFCDTSKEMSKLYIANAKVQLMKDLPFHLSKIIDSVLRGNNFHYLPTLRALRKEKGARKTKRTVGGKQPGDLDDIFLKELCFAKMEDKIKKYHKQKEEQRKLAFEQAKEAGDLQECQCCFDDEVLKSDMSSCEYGDEPHYFCNVCIRRYSEEEIGQGKLAFKCLNGECKSPFSLNTLKKLLKPSIFSNLLKRKQAEEIAAAGIEDLESCSFCNFATIMPNKEDKVFKCLNPECLKDSCRLCKEPNHIPLRCEEVEKKKQTDARTYLENEMSEAVVRECYKCKKRFIKEEGCNKMVCSCGAMMCYLCKQPIKGYDHFSQDNRLIPSNTAAAPGKEKCPLWSNSLKLHAEEVQQRAAEAKKNLDPNVQLLHDPTKDLPQVPDYLIKNQNPVNILQNPPVPVHIPHGPDLNAAILGNPGNNIPHLVAEFLLAENRRRIQRHSHQHRHTHFYIPMAHLPPPPPAHLPPPPPAHHHHHHPPPPPPPYQNPFMEHTHQYRINRVPPNFPAPRQDIHHHPHLLGPQANMGPLYYHDRHALGGGLGLLGNQPPLYRPPPQFHNPNLVPIQINQPPQQLPPAPHQHHPPHFFPHRPPRNQRRTPPHHLPHSPNNQRYQF